MVDSCYCGSLLATVSEFALKIGSIISIPLILTLSCSFSFCDVDYATQSLTAIIVSDLQIFYKLYNLRFQCSPYIVRLCSQKPLEGAQQSSLVAKVPNSDHCLIQHLLKDKSRSFLHVNYPTEHFQKTLNVVMRSRELQQLSTLPTANHNEVNFRILSFLILKVGFWKQF